MSSVNLQLEPDALEPVITRAVEMALAKLDAVQAALNGKLAYSESEAADLLSLEVHQLRDERLRGRIQAYQIVGRRIRYRREDLVAYLLREPWTEETKSKAGWQKGRRRKEEG
jgi:hypothetical protein